MSLPARTPAELCTMYSLHPEFRDLFVEGMTDVRFWRWLLRGRNLKLTNVYSGDDIEPTSDNQKKNNKFAVAPAKK